MPLTIDCGHRLLVQRERGMDMPLNVKWHKQTLMLENNLFHLPTIQQLLLTEVMAEAQVLSGENLEQRHVTEIVPSTELALRPNSLLVSGLESLSAIEQEDLVNLAGIVVVGSGSPENHGTRDTGTISAVEANSSPGSSAALALSAVDSSLERLERICAAMTIPLLQLLSFGEPIQFYEEIRATFLKEVRGNTAKLHEHFLKVVLAEGLDGLVHDISNRVGRPVVVETANFHILASRNMGGTPQSQRQALTEQLAVALHRGKRNEEKAHFLKTLHIRPFKIGRRLVAPILVEEVAVGFISCATKANENLDMLSDFLQPAAAACTVDFYQRRGDGTIVTVTQKSLLKDLLSGRGLSAAEQERVERHYGFDLCDGLMVFAIDITGGGAQRAPQTFDESLAATEVEGTRTFVVPYNHKEGKTWQQLAEDLKSRIRTLIAQSDGKFQDEAQRSTTRGLSRAERSVDSYGGAEEGVDGRAALKSNLRIQIGAGRLAPNILGLAEAYREARQALIIGNMLQGEQEFTVSYGDLGIKRLLYLMIDHPELQRFYEENLAPLERYDAEWESELVPSLRVYLEQGANLNSAARALFIHRHTMNYRLEQIADILKIDIDSQAVLLNLQIAFLIRDMKQGIQGKH